MKITSMIVLPMKVPYLCDIGAPFSTTEHLGAVAVLLRTDAGLVGENLLIAVNGKRLSVLVEMIRSLEPLIVGRDPLLAAGFFEDARLDTRHLGSTGVSLIGIGAIDGALLDLRARAASMPVHRLLGAMREKVPAYYSGALWLHVGLDELQKTARRIVERGYWGMKLRVGPGSLASQIDRVRAVREAVGSEVRLLIDSNQRLDEQQALRLGRALGSWDIHWFEEPVDARDHAGEARLAAALDVPIASGESAFSHDEFRLMIEHRCADILMPDVQRVGGPTEFLRIGQLAAASNVRVSGHTAPEMTLSLMACLPNGDCLEVMPWATPCYAEQVRVEGGFAHASPRPGWGHALDPAALRRFALETVDL